MYYWLASISGFLHTDFHDIPDDAVPISEETWRSLLDGQTNGKQIITGKNGFPILSGDEDQPAETAEPVKSKKKK
jgi:hypothetical protein